MKITEITVARLQSAARRVTDGEGGGRSAFKTMTKSIPLTQGKVALVDDQDYERVSAFKWHFIKGYAARNGRVEARRKYIYMHREILDVPDGIEVDHRNRNGVDNRRCNLRIATSSQNKMNEGKRKDNASGYRGVYLHHASGKWVAGIQVNKRRFHLGYFDSAEQAARAYDRAAYDLCGDFAATNFQD